jgi:hypothetical protein
MRRATVCCVLLAVASLALSRTPGFDPSGWVLWGRELTGHGTFSTLGYPSWKPLPALVDTAFAWVAPGWVPSLWLVVARAAGLLAIVLAARVAFVLGGRGAAVAAALGIVLLRGLWPMLELGASEPLLIALVLGALDRHLAGQPRAALALGLLAALLRPETWPFVGLYALWVLWRGGWWTRLGVAVALPAVPLLWFGGDYLGSGDAWHGSYLAKISAEATALGHATWRPHAAPIAAGRGLAELAAPLLAGAVYACVARSPRRRELQVLTVGALGLVGVVAYQAVTGYAGLGRFSLPAAAVLCVVGACGVALAAEAVAQRRAAWLPAGALAVALAAPWALATSADVVAVRDQAVVFADARAAAVRLERSGVLAACGPLAAAPPAAPALAETLDRPVHRVAAFNSARLVILPAAGADDWPQVDRWLHRHPHRRPVPGFGGGDSVRVYSVCGGRRGASAAARADQS